MKSVYIMSLVFVRYCTIGFFIRVRCFTEIRKDYSCEKWQVQDE
jgi:hypothetical protein